MKNFYPHVLLMKPRPMRSFTALLLSSRRIAFNRITHSQEAHIEMF